MGKVNYLTNQHEKGRQGGYAFRLGRVFAADVEVAQEGLSAPTGCQHFQRFPPPPPQHRKLNDSLPVQLLHHHSIVREKQRTALTFFNLHPTITITFSSVLIPPFCQGRASRFGVSAVF